MSSKRRQVCRSATAPTLESCHRSDISADGWLADCQSAPHAPPMTDTIRSRSAARRGGSGFVTPVTAAKPPRWSGGGDVAGGRGRRGLPSGKAHVHFRNGLAFWASYNLLSRTVV